MPPQIIVELVGDPPSAPDVPLLFPFSKIATAPPQVKLKLASIIGVSSVVWSIVDQDENALAVLSDPAALEPTFTPTTAVSGTYLIQVLVNGNQIAQSGIAFTTKNLVIRKPASSEKTLFDAADGWKIALNRAFDSVDAVHDAAAEEDWKNSARLRVDGDALAAHTRIGNVITADVNGLLSSQDGRTPADGDSIVLDFLAPNVDAGVYDINTVGSAGTKFQFTRRTDFDEDTDVTEGIRVPIADGDDFGGKVLKLATVGTITINTTAIDFITDLGVGGAGFDEVLTKTTANNGETLAVGKGYLVIVSDENDVDLKFPDSASGVKVGQSITLLLATSANIGRALFDRQGADEFIGMGFQGSETRVALQGDLLAITVTFLGSVGGSLTWLFVPAATEGTDNEKLTADVATSAPLPPFTASGNYPDEILTANQDGALVVDGLTPSLGDFRAPVLVGSELTTDRQHHGLYDVTQIGDGSNPSILRKHTKWSRAGHVLAGTVVHILRGDRNAGKTYLSPSKLSLGTEFDWVQNSAGPEIKGEIQTTTSTIANIATYQTIKDGVGIVIKGSVEAYEPATDDHKVWSFTIRAHRSTGSVVQVDNVFVDNGPDQTAGAVLWLFTVDVGGGGLIRFRGTGEGAHTIDWSILAHLQESS